MGVTLERVRDATAHVLRVPLPGTGGVQSPHTLRRVIAVGQSQERDGVTATVLSVEDYDEAFVVALLVVAVADPERSAAAAPDTLEIRATDAGERISNAARVLTAPGALDLVAADDPGGRYGSVARRGDWTGTAVHWRGALPCTPALNPAARELRLELDDRTQARSWTFTIPLQV